MKKIFIYALMSINFYNIDAVEKLPQDAYAIVPYRSYDMKQRIQNASSLENPEAIAPSINQHPRSIFWRVLNTVSAPFSRAECLLVSPYQKEADSRTAIPFNALSSIFVDLARTGKKHEFLSPFIRSKFKTQQEMLLKSAAQLKALHEQDFADKEAVKAIWQTLFDAGLLEHPFNPRKPYKLFELSLEIPGNDIIGRRITLRRGETVVFDKIIRTFQDLQELQAIYVAHNRRVQERNIRIQQANQLIKAENAEIKRANQLIKAENEKILQMTAIALNSLPPHVKADVIHQLLSSIRSDFNNVMESARTQRFIVQSSGFVTPDLQLNTAAFDSLSAYEKVLICSDLAYFFPIMNNSSRAAYFDETKTITDIVKLSTKIFSFLLNTTKSDEFFEHISHISPNDRARLYCALISAHPGIFSNKTDPELKIMTPYIDFARFQFNTAEFEHISSPDLKLKLSSMLYGIMARNKGQIQPSTKAERRTNTEYQKYCGIVRQMEGYLLSFPIISGARIYSPFSSFEQYTLFKKIADYFWNKHQYNSTIDLIQAFGQDIILKENLWYYEFSDRNQERRKIAWRQYLVLKNRGLNSYVNTIKDIFDSNVCCRLSEIESGLPMLPEIRVPGEDFLYL